MCIMFIVGIKIILKKRGKTCREAAKNKNKNILYQLK